MLAGQPVKWGAPGSVRGCLKKQSKTKHQAGNMYHNKSCRKWKCVTDKLEQIINTKIYGPV